jgi:hypothetical protein
MRLFRRPTIKQVAADMEETWERVSIRIRRDQWKATRARQLMIRLEIERAAS